MLATQICFPDSTAEKAEEVINADLANVNKWYEQNRMKRNTSIYQAIVMGNSAISITGELEMLGVAVDDKMKFERHIANVCRKVSQQIAVLKQMKKILPFETRKCPYLGFIIPHFNKNITAKLEKVNERTLRFVFNEKQMPYCELLDKIGLPSLANQRLAKIVCMVLNAINSDHAPRSITELFEHRKSHYDLRGNNILKLPKASITDSFRTLRSFKVFKNKIRIVKSDRILVLV